MAEKYYNIRLNNNIFMDTSRYGFQEGAFVNKTIDNKGYADDRYNFKKKGIVKKKAEGIWGLLGIYDDIEDYIPLDKIAILGYEKDGKIYDFVTGIEIPFANKQDAQQYNFITHNQLLEWNENSVAKELEKLTACPQNIIAYKIRMMAVKKESEKKHLEFLKNVKASNETLARSRKVIGDFRKKYGK